METRMSKTSVLVVAAVGLMLMQCGCGAGKVVKTGFLSDYSRMKVESESTMRYVNEPALAKYSSFIVDRVGVHFHSGADAIEDKTKGKLTQEKIDDLTNYFHSKLVEAVKESGHSVVYQPGPGVARIRTAITDIDETSLVTLYPGAKISGLGLGGAALEAEIIDSSTGEQIAGLVEVQKGSRIPFVGLGKWDAAKQAMDEWAKRLKKRLEEIE